MMGIFRFFVCLFLLLLSSVSFSSDTDGDEVAPEITSSGEAAVLQSAGPGIKVYQATADDSQDVSDGFTFDIDGPDGEEFDFDDVTGEVFLIAVPNDNPNRVYNFEVFATDADGNQSIGKSVVLSIIPEDLIAPVLISADSAVAIDENSGPAQVVYTAVAEDLTVVTYSLAGVDANKFEINSASGKVTLIADPDYETQDTYSFDVKQNLSRGMLFPPIGGIFEVKFPNKDINGRVV